MLQRIPINSKSIRQRYTQLYRDVFSRCQVVVSAPDSFFWSGEFARFFGGMTILQKLPTKNVVGLELINENTIEFSDDLYGYSPHQGNFINLKYDPVKEIRLIKYLEKIWPTLNKNINAKGFRIHIISESHCGGGLGTNGIINACLASCLMLLAGEIDSEDPEKWENAPVNDLLNNPNYEKFRKTFRLAWNISARIRNGNASGATSFCSFLKTQYPVVYLSEDVNEYHLQISNHELERNSNGDTGIDSIAFWGGRLEEMFPLNMPQSWTVDLGRVFSGTLINTENIFKSLYQLKVDFEELQEVITQEVVSQIRNPKLKEKMLIASSDHLSGRFSYQEYLNIFNIITARMLLNLVKLFEVGPSEEAYREFFDVFVQSQDFNRFLRHSNASIDAISLRLSKILSENSEIGVAGVKMEGVGKGGHLLFATPLGSIPLNLNEEVEQMAKDTKREITLDWASWQDGFGEDGVKVEQMIDENIYAPFLSSQPYRLTLWENDQKQSRVADQAVIDGIINQFDLVLMEPTHKVFVGGTAQDSKNIVSAKATIDILKKTLDSPDGRLTNKEIQGTSYGQSRYDLQSKIFAPLQKSVKKYANKTLRYKIEGEMYDNYSVTLEPGSLTIALIEAIK